MKRSTDSDIWAGSDLKRRSSSLFSIATLSEGGDIPGGVEGRVLSVETTVKTAATRTANTRSVSPSTSSRDNFFIEDHDDGESSSSVSSSTPTPFRTAALVLSEGDRISLGNRETVSEASGMNPGDLRTGLVFEAAERHFDRRNRFHKERSLRITSIREALANSNDKLLERCRLVSEEEGGPETNFLNDQDFLRVHLPGYMQRLDKLSNCNCCDRLDREAEQYNSIYLTQDTTREAKVAAGSLCRLVSLVVEGKLDNGCAIIRPPGHHAEPGMAGGYCVINNVAVAARYAKENLRVSKILIVDWDVHHGNGTQSTFLCDPDVLYFSVHRWHGGNFFPFLANGGPTTVGTGEGSGFNVNIGWSRKGMGDEEYLAAWETVLLPIAKEFQPELILISAGFDAADGDMGECHVTPECFGRLTRSLMGLAQGKVVCALEGGYVRSVLGKCVLEIVRTLIDRNSTEIVVAEQPEDDRKRNTDEILECIEQSARNSIKATIAAHQPYWSCFDQPS